MTEATIGRPPKGARDRVFLSRTVVAELQAMAKAHELKGGFKPTLAQVVEMLLKEYKAKA